MAVDGQISRQSLDMFLFCILIECVVLPTVGNGIILFHVWNP